MATQFSQTVINKALTDRPWVTKVSEFVYRVMSRKLRDARREHGKYEVTFSWDHDGLPEIQSCVEERTGEPCKGFYFHGYCVHGASLSIHLLQRYERREAA